MTWATEAIFVGMLQEKYKPSLWDNLILHRVIWKIWQITTETRCHFKSALKINPTQPFEPHNVHDKNMDRQ